MTLAEYMKEVKDVFSKLAKRSQKDIDDYFNEPETIKYIKEGYTYYKNDGMPEAHPNAVASCLDMMY